MATQNSAETARQGVGCGLSCHPGSSIHAVYDEAVPEILAAATTAVGIGYRAAVAVMRADHLVCTWFNPSATIFDDLVALPDSWPGATAAGIPLPAQRDGDQVLVRLHIPAHGCAVLHRCEKQPLAVTTDDSLQLGNALLQAGFDGDGHLVSLIAAVDGRELMASPGNLLMTFEDRPHCHDAWDIDEQVTRSPRDHLVVQSIHRVCGPLWQELVLTGRIGDSTMTQHIRLRPGSARLDFRSTVDWCERHKLLRVGFPTTLTPSGLVGEIQYGHLERPTHRNTSWDAARFEVCCHRWASLTERDRGFALLNDSKYGYYGLDGTIGLSLLRSPTDPDPVADLGRHDFVYAILPHDGHPADGPVRAEAAMLNAGAVRLDGLDASGFSLPAQLVGRGGELAVLKPAEDGHGLIARVIEVRGSRARVTLMAPGHALQRCSLLEQAANDDSWSTTGTLDLDLGPFAIETIRLVPLPPPVPPMDHASPGPVTVGEKWNGCRGAGL